MALFGFNKSKVLAAAEKYVQTGKLPQAISEYEKIIKEDPKDLIVMNTIGDLSSRVGDNVKAGEYFKRVGDAYATDGFTVKAIANYKKLTKLNPGSLENMARLAELYTTQGLYADARGQYVAIADQHMKAGQNEEAAKTFKKILELDPENTAMQRKLADLYLKLGKKTEARDIFFNAAQSLYAKQAMDQADEALVKVLELDPKNVDALLLRGNIAAESGNAAVALEVLAKVPDLDSSPEGLRSMLRAHLMLGHTADCAPLAAKLVEKHNDLSGVSWLAETFFKNGQFLQGLDLFKNYADKIIAANAQALQKALVAVENLVKDDAPSLEILLELFLKVGDKSHEGSLKETLAHSYARDKRYDKARDLYQELAKIEPENPIHEQNYKQMVALLSNDPMMQAIPKDVAEQALMVDEIEQRVPVIKHIYPPEIGAAVRQALTDSELFASYNLPAKAIPPLENALNRAPKDSQVNQRLAALYAKVQHYEKAAQCCEILKTVYSENRYPDEGKQFATMAAKYFELAKTIPPPPLPVEAAPTIPASSVAAAAGDQEAEQGFSAADFGMEDVPQPPPPPPPVVIDGPSSWDEIPVEGEDGAAPTAEALPAAVVTTPPAPDVPPAEIAPVAPVAMEAPVAAAPQTDFEMAAAPAMDMSIDVMPASPAPAVDEHTEWESMTDVHPVEVPPPPPVNAGPLIEEAKFFIGSSMWQEAETALGKLESTAPGNEEIAPLRQQLTDAKAEEERSIAAAKMASEKAEAEKAAAEKTAREAEEREAAEKAAKESATKTATEKAAAEKAAKEAATKAAAEKTAKEAAAKAAAEKAAAEKEAAERAAAEQAAAEAAAEESVHELIVEPEPEPPPPPKPTPKKEPAKAAPKEEPKLEKKPAAVAKKAAKTEEAEELLADVVETPPAKKAPAKEPAKEAVKPAAKAPAKVAPPPTEAADDLLGDLVSDLEESLGDAFDFAGGDKLAQTEAPQTVAAEAVPEGFSSMEHKLEETAPEIEHNEAANVLSDLFDEFKEDVEEDTGEPEDPDTHYNLGIAFKEMGLYDEAIGELQKVCHALDKGMPFTQPVQAYTWLAQCFIEKGAPQASIRWYEKALKVKGINEDSRLAINYDLGVAHESSGNKKEALAAFMACYASNIDYRDVADRVKALKK